MAQDRGTTRDARTEDGADAGVPLALQGRVALITGGSRGIGAAAVRLFRQAGALVAFSYRASRDRANALAAECGGDTVCRAFCRELDDAAAGRMLVSDTLTAFGRLDCLVVNHGIWPPEDVPLATMGEGQWRRTLGVNLDSVFGLLQAATGAMLRQGPRGGGFRGHIVLVSSTAGQRGEAFHADYAATKGALISLTKSLSGELAPQGIRVNCIAPGWVDTEMSAPALSSAEGRARVVGGIPIGRVGSVEEIAGPILFLCTPWAGFISGEVLNVNGGAVLVG
jgi:3-oxoacyl-[acyl-carrier protein] reductase